MSFSCPWSRDPSGALRWMEMDLHVSSRLKIFSCARGHASKQEHEQAGAAPPVVSIARAYSLETPVGRSPESESRAMMDFDERVPVGSNMYLPSCTYYTVPGTDFTSLPPFLPQTPSTCPVTYSYTSPSLPQVQTVREVSFRDYGIDSASKWHHHHHHHHRSSSLSVAHCCGGAPEDAVLPHRDCLTSSPGTLGEMFAKNNSVVYHHSAPPSHAHHTHAPNLYGSVGRNGVLPQAFDQFFETAYGGNGSDNVPTTEHSVDGRTSSSKPPPPLPLAPESVSDTCRETGEKERHEDNSSPESSSGNNDEKCGGGDGGT